MGWFKKTKKNKAQTKKQQNKPIGATPITPAFTADRAFVYLVGGAATLAGLFVIYSLVKKGLNEKIDGSEKPSVDGEVSNSNSLQINISNRSFPIRYEGFNPSYRAEVVELQTLLVQAGQQLPVYGIDGRFGPETLVAVQKQFGSNYKTQVERGEFVALQEIANLKSKNVAGLGMITEPIKHNISVFEPIKHNVLGSLGCGCEKCSQYK